MGVFGLVRGLFLWRRFEVFGNRWAFCLAFASSYD